jgi:hypothetical protein
LCIVSQANDLAFVRRVVAQLEAQGILTWLFGGWAEELVGLSLPREHHDVDLLYPGEDFRLVDEFLAAGGVDEITAKRFPHKRAFETAGLMVELFLVRRAGTRYYTDFWGVTRHWWPPNMLDVDRGGLRVASDTALVDYRANWTRLLPSIDGKQVSSQEWLQRRGN